MNQKTLEDLWGRKSSLTRKRNRSPSPQLKEINTFRRSNAVYPFNVFQKSHVFTRLLQSKTIGRFHHNIGRNDMKLVAKPCINYEGGKCPVLSFLLDAREEYVVVHHKAALQLYSTSKWSENRDLTISSDSLLLLRSDLIQARRNQTNSFSFGFSAVRFLGNSLNIISGYHRTPVIEIFDLERVDEEVCDAFQSFSLDKLPSLRAGVDQVTAAQAFQYYSEHCIVAGLSDGRTVIVDPRRKSPVICTNGATALLYHVGAPSSHGAPSRSQSCITSLAANSHDSVTQLICGTKDGFLQLWDLRMTRNVVHAERVCSEISHMELMCSPSSHSRVGCPHLWLNSAGGYTAAYGVGGTSVEKHVDYVHSDVVRCGRNFSVAPPKLSLHHSGELMLLPNISGNLIELFDLNSKRAKNSLPFHSTGAVKSELDALIQEAEEENDEVVNKERLNPFRCLPLDHTGAQVSCANWLERYNSLLIGTAEGNIWIL